jgi:hypothetical protein
MDTTEFKLGKASGIESADRLIASLKMKNPAGIALELWDLYDMGCSFPYNPGPPSSIRKSDSATVQLNYGKGFDCGFMETVHEQLKVAVPTDSDAIEMARRKFLGKKYGIQFNGEKPLKELAKCH